MSPAWARVYLAYEQRVPNHRGKRTLLRLALRGAARARPRPFPWEMKNGVRLAIAPTDGLGFQGTVGWTCFRSGRWDSHIERCLRDLVGPGDRVVDVGANIGYFASVLAQRVGPAGEVLAFEPVPGTWQQLQLAASWNDYAWMAPLQIALGAEDGSIEMAVDPRNTGNASIHRPAAAHGETIQVPVRRLDDVLAERPATAVALIKIDVEGHELDVLRGARETIARDRPTILFEYAPELADRAGWHVRDVKALLDAAGGHDFLLLDEDGLRPVDIDHWTPPPAQYAFDIVARPSVAVPDRVH